MSPPSTIEHGHQPIVRVVRASWPDPLDASFSKDAPSNRWNDRSFEALYCCCSERVASAVARDVLKFAAVDMDDLQPSARPQLVEIGWSGSVVDVVSPEGVQAAGFPADYPRGVTRVDTRRRASNWHASMLEGVVCRSASLGRFGFSSWTGEHQSWGEIAIFTQNAISQPTLLNRRSDLLWYTQ